MARKTLSTSPVTVVTASTVRRALEMVNATDTTVYVRHGGMVDLGSDTACGIPIAPGGSRSVTDDIAKLSMTAVLPSGSTAQAFYFEEY